MDITKSNSKLKANKFINGETINYSISFLLSFTALICVKQLLKTFFGVSVAVAVPVAFVIGEVCLYLTQRFFVYKNEGLNGNIKQIIFAVINSALHLGIYKLLKLIACDYFGLYDFSAWFFTLLVSFILSYPFSRLLTFDCITKPENKKNGRIYRLAFSNRAILLAMAVSAVSLVFIYGVFSAFPFNDTTVLRMDLYHQYGPLFVELFDRVSQHKTFLYSFTSGGGTSFLGNYFNYLSSPLTALIFLFDRVQMPFAISFLVFVKCVLSSGSFTLYLKKSQNGNSIICSAFGVLYSFSAYFLAYFWNIMWLDAMILFPMLILGIELIINRERSTLYIASLVLYFVCNYYMGFMACIFSVIYFLLYSLLAADGSINEASRLNTDKKLSVKRLLQNKFISNGLRFAVSSLIAGALCAFILLPVYFILTGSSATSDSFPKSASLYFNVFDFLTSHFAMLETTIRSSGNDILPNVYCGVICLILVPLFVINKEIRLKEKAVYIGLLLLLMFSFDLNIANYLWHAFHFPNDLPYRFSYMYSFIMLVISFKALQHIRAIGIKEIGFTAMAWVAFAAVSQELPTEKMGDYTAYITIAFIIVWCAALFMLKKNIGGRFVISVLVIAITFCEVIISDTKAFGFNQQQSNYVQNYDTYVEDIDYIKQNDDGLYKTELTNLVTRMDPCLYGYDGMSIFSSMAYEDYSHLQYNLGMYGNRINSYTYNTQTPVYNMMYNIKYLIYKDEKARPSTEYYTRYYESGDLKSVVFTNDYFLPVAFAVKENINGWDTTENNPFRVQGEFFVRSTGLSGVFKEVNYIDCSYDGVSGESIENNGSYWFISNGSSGDIKIKVKPNTNGNLYVYVSTKDIATLSADYKDKTIIQELSTPYILDLGSRTVDDEIEITLDCEVDDDSDGNFDIYCYSVDNAILDAGYRILKDSSLDIEKFSETQISGTISIKENSVLYSSIPYDKGWSVKVDGKKAETFGVGNCQLGIMLKPGEHKIEYKYSPNGLVAGSLISLATVILLIAYLILKINKENADNDYQTIPNSDNFIKSLK